MSEKLGNRKRNHYVPDSNIGPYFTALITTD